VVPRAAGGDSLFHLHTGCLADVITSIYDDNMIRTQISFDKALYERAKRLARRQRISLAELCRRGVLDALSKEPSDRPWMAFAGFYDGHPDDSTSVDDVLYGRETP